MVSMFVAITDRSWFDQLSILGPDEVNFWLPSGKKGFRALRPGELLLFKLHSPDNFIVGGGIFSHATKIQMSIAWDAFGIKNGVESIGEMRARIAHYKKDRSILDPRTDPVIGCLTLTQPFFWPRHLWLPVPENFARNIVRGKKYATDSAEGLRLWQEVEARSFISPSSVREGARYGEPQLVRPRLGQGTFRLAVTDAYERRCAVSGERTLPLLDAAHIKAYREGGEHETSNGLLLRTDIHRLFDLGYVTVGDDDRFNVSRRLKEDFDNGRLYYGLHGEKVRSPTPGYAPPSADALAWHRQYRYLG